MLGDSVRICNQNGHWSGMEPVCVAKKELSFDDYKAIKERGKEKAQMPRIDFVNDTTGCGLPGMGQFSKPGLGGRYSYTSQRQFFSHFAHGETVYDHCESPDWSIGGDIGPRKCVNGQWNGTIGQCGKLRNYFCNI